MNRKLREDADRIIEKSISAVKPDEAVRRALAQAELSGGLIVTGPAGTNVNDAAVGLIG